MTIIEFAYLSLPPPTTSKTPKLLENLITVTKVIEGSSQLPTRFFSSVEDENVMFVIGGWPSKSAHQDGFDGSAEQAKLFPLIEGMMQIDWMEYFDVPHEGIPTWSSYLLATLWRCGDLDPERKEELQSKLTGQFRDSAGHEDALVIAQNIRKERQNLEEDLIIAFSGWPDADAAKRFEEGIKVGCDMGGIMSHPQSYLMERTQLLSS